MKIKELEEVTIPTVEIKANSACCVSMTVFSKIKALLLKFQQSTMTICKCFF